MSIYLDTSALAKLIVTEDESQALRALIGKRRGIQAVTNVLGVVELQRLAARIGQAAVSSAVQLLSRIDQLDITPLARARAAHLSPPQVRTRDALHVASASELTDLEAIVTYDLRVITAAEGAWPTSRQPCCRRSLTSLPPGAPSEPDAGSHQLAVVGR